MNKKKLIKNILCFLAFAIMIYLFILFGTKDYSVKIEDNVRFAQEYKDISKNNVFVYTNGHEILNILNGKSGIIFMGFPSNEWSHYYADYLNEIALLNDIDKIYYYDFKKDRELNNTTYVNIVNKLKDYLYITDTNYVDLFAPSIWIIKDGKVIFTDSEVYTISATMTPKEYFTDYKKNLFMSTLDNAIKEYLNQGEENER